MGAIRKFLSLVLWCSLSSQVSSQGYYYKRQNVNAYQLVNGKFQYIPTTTPHPSLLETIFPWTGNAYDSAKSPEEDAAIMNSLADEVSAAAAASSGDGILSWLSLPSMSMPSMPTMSIPSLSIPGFSSSENTADSTVAQEQVVPFPSGMLSPVAEPTMNFQDTNLMGSFSQAQPVYSSSPAENQIPVEAIPPPQQQLPPPPQPQLPPQQVSQYPLPNPNYIHDVRNNVNPTFQFHQQMKDSLPLPSPSIAGLGQPMFPYPYSAPVTNPDFMKSAPEKTASFMDMLSNYFTFGKRSDLENILKSGNVKIIDSRSSDESEEKASDESNNAAGEYHNIPNQREAYFDFEATREALEGKNEKNEKDFLCPKTGIWRWNGEVCIAVGPVPVWACKPNDLIVSGKIAICRNKIYFSPKVINNHHHD